MNNHLLFIALIFIACSEEKVPLISNTPPDLPDQNYKLNLQSNSGEALESVTINWDDSGNDVSLNNLSTENPIDQSGKLTGLTPGEFLDIEVSTTKNDSTYKDTIQIFTRTVYPVTDFSFETEAIKLGEGVWNSWEEFIDRGNGIWNAGEPFEDEKNGTWDEGESFEDLNDDGIWNAGESFEDEKNGTWDEGESFEDLGNGVYDEEEHFFDKDTTKYHRNLKWTMTNESNAKYIVYRINKANIDDLVNSVCNTTCQLEVLTSLSKTTYIDSSSNVIDEYSEDAFYYRVQVQVSTGNFTRNSFIYSYIEFTQPEQIQLTEEDVSTDKDEFIEITWNPIPNSDYFYQYEIWRSSNEELSDKTRIAIIIDHEQGKFMDRTAGNGTTWYYSVVVVDIGGGEQFSDFVPGWSRP